MYASKHNVHSSYKGVRKEREQEKKKKKKRRKKKQH
jgi:hypothetical protein